MQARPRFKLAAGMTPEAVVADRFVVVLDANVLYPFRVRDVLLRFAEAGLFRARWSPEILDEWTRNLIAEEPHLQASIRSQQDAMAPAFPEAMVEGHEGLIQALDLPDENDRHVLDRETILMTSHKVSLSEFADSDQAAFTEGIPIGSLSTYRPKLGS